MVQSQQKYIFKSELLDTLVQLTIDHYTSEGYYVKEFGLAPNGFYILFQLHKQRRGNPSVESTEQEEPKPGNPWIL